MNTVLASSSASAAFVGLGWNPPSTAISRGLIPSRVSSATVSGNSVFSLGLPTWWEAGRISPRAPGLVCSVTSVSWLTYPNSVGLPILPLRIGRASGSDSDTIRSVIFSPASRWRICLVTFSHRSANSSSFRAAVSLARAPRPRARRLAAAASLRASLTERSNSSPVSLVNSSTSVFASPERRRIVRAIPRSFRPIARERSRTRARFSPTSF
jgi:hypothetical protein